MVLSTTPLAETIKRKKANPVRSPADLKPTYYILHVPYHGTWIASVRHRSSVVVVMYVRRVSVQQPRLPRTKPQPRVTTTTTTPDPPPDLWVVWGACMHACECALYVCVRARAARAVRSTGPVCSPIGWDGTGQDGGGWVGV